MINHILSKTSMYFIFTVCFVESILYFTGTADKNVIGYLTVILFSLFFATLVSGILRFVRKPNVYRTLTVITVCFFSLLGCAEFCINNAFGFYMTFKDMIGNGGNAVGGFTSNVVGSILGNLHILFLIYCPTIVYVYCWKHKMIHDDRKNNFPCYILLTSAVVLFGLSLLTIKLSGRYNAYTIDYSFDNSVRSFGLSSSLRLDLIRRNQPITLPQAELTSEEFFFPSPTPTPTLSLPTPDIPNHTEVTDEFTPEATPTPTPIIYHDCGIDFEALAEEESNSTFKTMDEYVASLTPVPCNEFTGLCEGYNLILITAEAFSREAIIPELMPTLYRMYNEGIHCDNYYQPAWGGSTSTGEFSNIVGLMPTDAVNSMMRTRYDNMYYTLGNQLRRLNYFSAGYHNNDYKYYNRHLTHCNLGYDTWTGYWNGLEEGLTLQWPESDLEMIDYTVPLYVNKEPFSIYYMSVSGHCSYHKGSNAMAAKNFSYVEDMECSNTIKCYYAANLEFEFAMESLLKQLEEANVLDHTLIVISPDHYPYGLDNSSAWGNNQDYLKELYGYKASDCFLRDHSVLIMWTPQFEDLNITVSDPVFSLDIVPTVSNLMGLDYDSRLLVGRDIFSTETPIIFWPNRSWMTNLGSYNASSGTFTLAEGIELDDDKKKAYIDTINSIVRNRISFSGNVVYNDYYGHLFNIEEN